MSGMKFAPWPWEVKAKIGDISVVLSRTPKPEENLANAYLIAAAPELYAAACDVVADFEESVSRYPSLLRLAAAIAKTEGRG